MKYTLNKEDLIKIAQAFGYSLASAAVLFLISVMQEIDFGEYTLLVPVINAVLYGAKKFLEGK